MSESNAFDEAIEEGAIKGQVLVFLRLGSRKFGPPDLDSESELKSIRDPGRLKRLVDAILTAKSWQEFLATP
jgi:hypothetical protein